MRTCDGRDVGMRCAAVPFTSGEDQRLFVSTFDLAKHREVARALREVSASKSEVLSNVSHEIRTPPNAVLGIARVLERTELGFSVSRHLVELVGGKLQVQSREREGSEFRFDPELSLQAREPGQAVADGPRDDVPGPRAGCW